MTDPISAKVIDQRIVARLDLAANEIDKIGALSLPTLIRQAASEIQHAADHIDAQADRIEGLRADKEAQTYQISKAFGDLDRAEVTIKALVEALEWYKLQVMRYGTSGLAWADEAAGLLDHDSGRLAEAAIAAAKEPT